MFGFSNYNYKTGSVINIGCSDEDSSERPVAIVQTDFNLKEQAEHFLKVCEKTDCFPYVLDFIDWLCKTGLCKKIDKNEYVFLPSDEADFGWFGLVDEEKLKTLQEKYLEDHLDETDE